ncbi:hypothetical protein Goarm_003212, partial [Gossypium armourianum]|nr:hypothetical protein [Gossypium armourianum]
SVVNNCEYGAESSSSFPSIPHSSSKENLLYLVQKQRYDSRLKLIGDSPIKAFYRVIRSWASKKFMTGWLIRNRRHSKKLENMHLASSLQQLFFMGVQQVQKNLTVSTSCHLWWHVRSSDVDHIGCMRQLKPLRLLDSEILQHELQRPANGYISSESVRRFVCSSALTSWA